MPRGLRENCRFRLGGDAQGPAQRDAGYALSRRGGWVVGWHRLEKTASYTIPHPKGLRTSTLDIRTTRTRFDGAGANCRSDEIEFCVGNGAHGERDQVVATRHGGIAIVDVTGVTLVISASNWETSGQQRKLRLPSELVAAPLKRRRLEYRASGEDNREQAIRVRRTGRQPPSRGNASAKHATRHREVVFVTVNELSQRACKW
jgi:hypothetical protein